MSVPVYFARTPDYRAENLLPALRRLLEPLLKNIGGAEGKRFMLKPNLLSWRKPDDPACTHPQVILGCAELLLELGASEVALVENPGTQDAAHVIEIMGLGRELSRLGVRVANCARYNQIDLPPEAICRRMELATEFRDFDAVVNLAKAKTHGMMSVTLGVKNLFGLVRGSERLGWHLAAGMNYSRFADLLIDIALTVKPQINLLDAVVCMEGNGPGSGEAAFRGFLAGAESALALDAALAPLLGAPECPQILRMRERGILPETELRGEIPECRPLRMPDRTNVPDMSAALPRFIARPLRRYLLSRPELRPERCIGCGLCVRVCPPRTLKVADGRAEFDLRGCIRCYCCQEHCPQGAIVVRRSRLMKLAGQLEGIMRRLPRPGVAKRGGR